MFKKAKATIPTKTRIPHSRKTLIKLQTALLEFINTNSINYLPEKYRDWYRSARIAKSTFTDSISTYANFLYFSKEELIEFFNSLSRMLGNANTDSIVNIFLNLFVLNSTDGRRAELHNERRNSLVLATIIFPPNYWEELFFFFKPSLMAEYKALDETVLDDLLATYAGMVRRYLLAWIELGTLEELLPTYKQIMILLLRNLFLANREYYGLKVLLKHQIATIPPKN